MTWRNAYCFLGNSFKKYFRMNVVATCASMHNIMSAGTPRSACSRPAVCIMNEQTFVIYGVVKLTNWSLWENLEFSSLVPVIKGIATICVNFSGGSCVLSCMFQFRNYFHYIVVVNNLYIIGYQLQDCVSQ